jgi:hypothetical protein
MDSRLYCNEIPFGFAQGRLSLRLKNGSGRDDSRIDVEHEFPN